MQLACCSYHTYIESNIFSFSWISARIDGIYKLVFGFCAHSLAASVDSNSHIYIGLKTVSLVILHFENMIHLQVKWKRWKLARRKVACKHVCLSILCYSTNYNSHWSHSLCVDAARSCGTSSLLWNENTECTLHTVRCLQVLCINFFSINLIIMSLWKTFWSV